MILPGIYRPKNSENIQEFLRVHALQKDGQVHVAPAHGGPMFAIASELFNQVFEIAPDELLAALKRTYKTAEFSIGDHATYEDRIPGYTNGQLWNGWQMPFFRREVIEQALEDQRMNTPYWKTFFFDEGAVLISSEGSSNPIPDDETFEDIKTMAMNGEELYEITLKSGLKVDAEWYPAQTITVDGEDIKVYPVGAGSWTWELAPEAPLPSP